ncbi:WD repeat-containing protein 89 [Aplysia californica]|uniref:WD repeat-containing protein 89 n=1 Tax=Aplysia californica TaxID=6500 RepID=A0ABM0ZX56_APLCA|nr:WD repeat-containing protein 89 [Aplysia californica]XP_012936338.1 WD repeat-containing protein 89 [Aplysia californica]
MENVSELLQQLNQLHLAEKSAVQIHKAEPDYVLDFAVQSSEPDPLVAAVCSNFNIRLMLRSRLTTKTSLCGHKSTVTGVTFGKTDPNVAFSCSKDKSVRCWDVRTNSETQILKTPPNVQGDFLSVDVSHSDHLLCAGTEKISDDAFLLFWDLRKRAVLGCYNECHDDDITQVSFKPGSDQYLASGSSDGLVCTFDLSETSEEDALQVTSNASSDVARVGWCGEDDSCVYCVTSDNMFYVWDALEGDELSAIEDLQSVLGEASPVQYLVDCIPELTAVTDKSSALTVGGTHSGDVQLISHSSSGSHISATLSGGHSATIRCSHWDNKSKTLLTGAEDSLLCLWSMDADASFSANTKEKAANKMRGKASVTGDGRKPYNKGRKKK